VSVSINQWSGGYTATFTVTAGSAAINGWTVAATLPAGSAITNSWNASASGTTGTVQFGNLSYNGSVSAGQSAQFGYQGTGTGSGMTPACSAR
jgi:hypothetical protein